MTTFDISETARMSGRNSGRLMGVAAALVAGGAGVYMLLTHAAASNSIFNPFLHGIGAYFLARGIWMLRQAGKTDDVVDRLDKLVELRALEHDLRDRRGGAAELDQPA